MLKIKKIIILVMLVLLLCGCQQESQEQNIENCKEMNGSPKITYCRGNSNMICQVECFINKKVGE